MDWKLALQIIIPIILSSTCPILGLILMFIWWDL